MHLHKLRLGLMCLHKYVRLGGGNGGEDGVNNESAYFLEGQVFLFSQNLIHSTQVRVYT